MSVLIAPRTQEVTVSRAPDPKLFVSLELSCSTWLVTSLSPDSDKMSKHPSPAAMGPGCSSSSSACGPRPSGAAAEPSEWFASKRPASRVSGCTGC